MRRLFLFIFFVAILASSGWAQSVSVTSTPANCTSKDGTVTITITATGQSSDNPSDYYVRIKKSTGSYGNNITVEGNASESDRQWHPHQGHQGGGYYTYTYTHTWTYKFSNLEAGDYIVQYNKSTYWSGAPTKNVTVGQNVSSMTLSVVSIDCDNTVRLRVTDPNDNHISGYGWNYYAATIDGKSFSLRDVWEDEFSIQSSAFVRMYGYVLVRKFATGQHTVIATDKNGCTASVSFIVNDSLHDASQIIINVTQADNATNNGEIAVSVKDNVGKAPFTYSIDGSSYKTASTFTGLEGNKTYKVYVKDACGNVANKNVFVPKKLVCIVKDSTHITCNGLSDGTVTIDADNAGGTGDTYRYRLNDGEWQSSNVLTGLSKGKQTITIQSMEGNTPLEEMASTSVIIKEPDAITLEAVADSIPCMNATATLSATNVAGGNGDYKYSWSIENGSEKWIVADKDKATVTIKPNGLADASYIVTVKDKNNCSASDTVKVAAYQTFMTERKDVHGCDTFEWKANDSIYRVSTIDTVYLKSVHNCDSVVSINLTVDYNSSTAYDTFAYYTYTWPLSSKMGHGDGKSYTSDTIIVGKKYTTDKNCPSYDTLRLAIDSLKLDETLKIDTFIKEATGSGLDNGSFQIVITDKPAEADQPFYSWLEDGTGKVFSSDTTHGNLSAGDYTICVAYSTFDTFCYDFTITEPEELVATLIDKDTVCVGGSKVLTVTDVQGGVEPYSYIWKVKNTNDTIGENASFTVSQATATTEYMSVVTDANDNKDTNYITLTVTTPVSKGYVDSAFYTYTWAANGDHGHGDAQTYTTLGLDTIVGPVYNVANNVCDNYDTLYLNIKSFNWDDEAEDTIIVAIPNDATGYGLDNGSILMMLGAPRTSVGDFYAWLTDEDDLVGKSDTLKLVNPVDTIFDSLYAGKYNLHVRIETYDTLVRGIEVGQPNKLVATLKEADSICVGGNKTLSVTDVQGGVEPYSYSWKVKGTAQVICTTATYNAAPLDTTVYEVVVTDDKNNKDTNYLTLVVSKPVSAGYVDSAFYTYTWNYSGGDKGYGADTTHEIVGLDTIVGKMYNVDNNVCENYDTLYLNIKTFNWDGDDDTIVVTSPNEPTGNGRSDGSIDMTLDAPLPNVGNYYAWLIDETTGKGVSDTLELVNPVDTIFDSLSAGDYKLYVRLEEYDTLERDITITEPAAITFTLTEDDEICDGGDKTLEVTEPAGGVGNYTYLWRIKNGDTLACTTATCVVTPHTATTYEAIVKDSNDNFHIEDVTISVNYPVSQSYKDTAYYTYTWAYDGDKGYGADTTYSIVGDDTLVGKVYQSPKGCDSYDTLFLNIKKYDWSNTFASSKVIDVTGFGRKDGSFRATINILSQLGAQEPLKHYIWFEKADTVYYKQAPLQNGSTDYSCGNLDTGSYTLKIRCEEFDTLSFYFKVSQPDSLVVLTDNDTAVCPGVSKTLTAFATGGIDTIYKYSWRIAGKQSVLSTDTTYTVTPKATTTYMVTVKDKNNNVDSAKVVVTVKNVPTISVDSFRCDNDLTFTWNSRQFTAVGTQNDTLTGSNHCDSIVVMTLNAYPTYKDTAYDVVLENEIKNGYQWRGINFPTTTVTDTFDYDKVSQHGCDSNVHFVLVVLENLDTTVYDTVCDVYTLTGERSGRIYSVTHDTILFDTLFSHTLSDSAVCHRVTVFHSSEVKDSQAVCLSALPVENWNEKTFSAAGTMDVTLKSVSTLYKCDSLVHMILTVNQEYDTTVDTSACDIFEWTDGSEYTQSVTGKQFDYKSIYNCDSTVTLNLTVYNNSSTAYTLDTFYTFYWNDSIWGHGDSLRHEVLGTNRYEGKEYKDANKCKSVDTLYLTIKKYDWEAVYDTDVYDPTAFGAADGHAVLTLINAPVKGQYSAWLDTGNTPTVHPIAHDGSVDFTGLAEGIYKMKLALNNYDTATIEIRIAQPAKLIASVPVFASAVCANQPDTLVAKAEGGVGEKTFMWKSVADGSVLSYKDSLIVTKPISGNYSYRVIVTDENNVSDSTEVSLKVNPNYITNLGDSVVCDSIIWLDGNKYVTDFSNLAPLTFDTFTVNHCDSTVTLNLTVHHTGHTGFDVEEYYSYTWDVLYGSQQTYVAGGTYFGPGNEPVPSSAKTCPRVDTLYLTIDTINWDDPNIIDTTLINPTKYGEDDGEIDVELNAPADGNYYVWVEKIGDNNSRTKVSEEKPFTKNGSDIFNGLTAGTYDLCVRFEEFDTFYYRFVINQPEEFYVSLSAPKDTLLCLDSTLTLSVGETNGGIEKFKYVWSVKDAVDTLSEEATFDVSPAESTVYVLSVTDSLGNVAHDTITIQVGYPLSTAYDTAAYYAYTWEYSGVKGHGTDAKLTVSDQYVGNVYKTSDNCDSYDTLNLTVNTYNWNDPSLLSDTVIMPTGYGLHNGTAIFSLNAPVDGLYTIWFDKESSSVDPKFNAFPFDTIMSYSGLSKDTNILVNHTDFTYSGLAAGTYHVKIAYDVYDTFDVVLNVTQPDSLVVLLNDDTAHCGTIQKMLVANTNGGSGEYTYSWTVNGEASAFVSDTIYVSPSATTTYKVFAIDTNSNIDSAVTTITVNDVYSNVPVTETACDTFFWKDGSYYTKSLTNKKFDYTTINGCDSIVYLTLTLNRNSNTVYDTEAYYYYRWTDADNLGHAISSNDTFFVDGKYAGREYTNASDCPSVDTLNLTISTLDGKINFDKTVTDPTGYGKNDGSLEVEINTPDTNTRYYIINPDGQDELIEDLSFVKENLPAGEYTIYVRYETFDTFPIIFTVKQPEELKLEIKEVEDICSGASATLSIQYTNGEAAAYVWKVVDIDDTIGTANELTVNPVDTTSYVLIMTDVNNNSVSDTVTVNVFRHIAQHLDTLVCDSFVWKHNELPIDTVKLSDRYFYSYTAEDNCVIVDTLDVTISPSYHFTESQEACDSLLWHDSVYHYSGTHLLEDTTLMGCDSTYTLNLLLHQTQTTTIPDNACDSFYWEDKGVTYYASIADTIIRKDVYACDSIVTLDINIHQSYEVDDPHHACDSMMWNNKMYYASNSTDTMMLKTVNNCDSIITLNLTMGYANTGVETRGECDSYLWIDSLYTASTTTVDTLTNVSGCDSVITLNLTISSSSVTYDNQTACDEFVWPLYQKAGFDSTFTASTDTFYYKTVNKIGCDSLVYLVLDLHKSFNEKFEAVVCDSLVIDTFGVHLSFDETFAKTVPFDVDLTDNCDTIIRFNLVVNYSAQYDFLVSCDDESYTWSENNTTYTRSGDYYVVYPEVTKDGCDSIIKLTLVITNEREGINDAESIQLSIYPNPTAGRLTIEGDDVQKVEVLDLFGRTVVVFENANVIDIANIAVGNYMLRVTTAHGIGFQRIIKR